MKFPAGFDPLAVTKLTLNGCYFQPADWGIACHRAEEMFPNAELEQMLFDDLPECCVMRIVPEPQLSGEGYRQLLKVIEDFLPQGPCRGMAPQEDGDD